MRNLSAVNINETIQIKILCLQRHISGRSVHGGYRNNEPQNSNSIRRDNMVKALLCVIRVSEIFFSFDKFLGDFNIKLTGINRM